jgi:hypothetical protein
MNTDLLKYYNHWVAERDKIRALREGGAPKPWTNDPILQQFKFCNVRREDDRVTRWFANNWRHARYWGEPLFIPNIMLGRTINWPNTLEHLGFFQTWKQDWLYSVLEGRKATGKKIYTGAYMVTQYGSRDPKNLLVTRNAGEYFRDPPKRQDTLQDMWKVLQTYPGMGPFMAAQVVADLKQTIILKGAPDWWDWASLGPGSTRGLNRLFDRSLNYGLNQAQGLEEMKELRSKAQYPYDLCLQDVQNTLCEFDKYMRVYMGQGLPRSRYDGFGP